MFRKVKNFPRNTFNKCSYLGLVYEAQEFFESKCIQNGVYQLSHSENLIRAF